MSPNQSWTLGQWQGWLELRQRARTDRYFLATEVLGYDWVCHKVHDKMIEFLPKLEGGEDVFDEETLSLSGYRPYKRIQDLTADRNYLLLYPRGTLKTTVATVTDTIQWILNYPDIRVVMVVGTGDQGEAVHDSIRKHFQFNEELRFLFPEFCPPASKAADWGNKSEFTVPIRKKYFKEPTHSMVSVGKAIAGYHYDLMKVCDVVDVNNSNTPAQIKTVINFMGYCEPLLELYPNETKAFRIVEGTPYDFSDYYCTIMDSEKELPEFAKTWKILTQSAKLDDGTALWPERLPIKELDRMENDPTIGPYIVSCQYYINPIPIGGGLAAREDISWVPKILADQIMQRCRLHVTIDLHGMEDTGQKSDSTCFNLSGFDRDGRCYVFDVRLKKFTPFQVIELIFIFETTYHPIDFKIEKEAHARVLLPFLQRECTKRQIFPVIVPIKRDSRISKKHRIKGLQPWFQAGIVRFSDGIQCKADIINQIVRYSDTSTYYDDFLDTMADQMQNRQGSANYDTIPTGERENKIPIHRPEDKFLGFDPLTHQGMWLYDRNRSGIDERYYHRGTGL